MVAHRIVLYLHLWKEDSAKLMYLVDLGTWAAERQYQQALSCRILPAALPCLAFGTGAHGGQCRSMVRNQLLHELLEACAPFASGCLRRKY